MQKFFLALIVLISIPFLVWFFKNPQNSIRSRFQTSKPVITPTEIKTNAFTGNCSSVRVNTPKPYEKISSLVIVSVTIDNSKKDCIWTVFEAQAGIAAITDLQGNTLGSAPLKTTGDWTAQKPVEYKASIPVENLEPGKNIILTIQEENPSGNANTKTISFPLSN